MKGDIDMKRIVTLFLVLVLLSFTGCRKAENTSSAVDITASELVTSAYESEISSDNVISDTSSEVNSVPSKTESTSTKPTVSSDKTESKSEISGTTIVTPTTYFEKYKLQLSPHNTNFCFNSDTTHNCGVTKKVTFTSGNITEHPLYNNDSVPKEQIAVSDYKYVTFETYGDRNACQYSTISLVFDKYTGTLLPPWEWVEISYNGETQKIISVLDGAGAGFATQSVFCPKNYDGLVFVVIPEVHKEVPTDGKTHTIDEFIDFENDKYFLFAQNN